MIKDYVNYSLHMQLLDSCKIGLSTIIISTCHPYRNVAAYQIWKESV